MVSLRRKRDGVSLHPLESQPPRQSDSSEEAISDKRSRDIVIRNDSVPSEGFFWGGRTPSAKQYLHEYSEVVAPDRSFWKLENIQRSWDKLTRGEGGLMVESSPTYPFVFKKFQRGAVYRQHHRYRYSLQSLKPSGKAIRACIFLQYH